MKHDLPQKVLAGILIGIFILLILHLTTLFLAYNGDIHYNDYIFQKTNFDEEKNAPSVFSSLLHLTASVLLLKIGFFHLKVKNRRGFWWFLSFLFLFLASDELLRIHEMAGRSLSSHVETAGIFHYSRVIIYGIGIIIIGLFCLKFLLELPKKTLKNFIVSGVIFISGALVIEMFTGWLIVQKGMEDAQKIIIPEFFILYTIEELLEMLGITYFIYSLLVFLRDYKSRKSLE